MASTLEIVRLVTLVIIGVALILNCISLADILGSSVRSNSALSSVIIQLIILFIGGYGSYYNKRTYLIGFALIIIIAIIVGFTSHSGIYYSLGFSIFTAVLALVQSELLRRSF